MITHTMIDTAECSLSDYDILLSVQEADKHWKDFTNWLEAYYYFLNAK